MLVRTISNLIKDLHKSKLTYINSLSGDIRKKSEIAFVLKKQFKYLKIN